MIPQVELVDFIDEFAITEDGQPLHLEDHQRRILTEAFKFDKEGRIRYRNIIYSCIKKEGKSTLAGVAGDWGAFTLDPPGEIYSCANDLEQSTTKVFNFCRAFIERNPVLRAEAEITAREIRLSNGSIIKALPIDAPGEAGANPTLTLWDELWGYQSESARRHYEEMCPSPVRKNSIRFIVTYAGWEGESLLLQELYERVFDKQGNVKPGVIKPFGDELPVYVVGDLFCYWDHQPRMPWQTKEYLDSQRRDLRLNTYLRLHENRWVSNESSFFDMTEWDACVDPDYRPPFPNSRLQLWVGADASTKKDRSAIVSVYRDGNMVCLGPFTTWQPTKAQPMDLEETMEAYIKTLSHNYEVVEVRYDPFQFHRSATTLLKDGINMVEFPQTVGNLTDMGQCLFDAVKHRTLKLYADADMRKEASFAVGKETPRGMRIVKEKSSHKIDAIVALAMATHAASTTPGEVEVWELPYQTESGMRTSGTGIARKSENDLWLEAEQRTAQGYEQRKRSFLTPTAKREIWDREWGEK